MSKIEPLKKFRQFAEQEPLGSIKGKTFTWEPVDYCSCERCPCCGKLVMKATSLSFDSAMITPLNDT